ncbi:MAG: hypothetical protein GXZ19_12390 [Bacteroidales bacterium]|nr:hypothetical protein [Bacteroidales bacterium]
MASEPEITEAIFAILIPIIGKYRTMEEDDKETFNRNMGLAMLENVDDIDTRSEDFQSALGTIVGTPDQNFVMDVLSLKFSYETSMIIVLTQEHD